MAGIEFDQRTVIHVEAETTELDLGKDFVADIPLCKVFRADFAEIEGECREFVNLTKEFVADGFVGKQDRVW